MAVTDWPQNWTITTSGSSGATYPVIHSAGGGSYVYSGGGSSGYSAPPPRIPTALEWLDAEVEATCKLARL